MRRHPVPDTTIAPMSISPDSRVAVVTGASSGIGEATARTLAAQGFHVVVGARRLDRLQKLADEIGGTALELDVTDEDSVDAFTTVLPRVDVLVNNAGGAKGLAPVAEAVEDDWRWMWETNVIGTMRITKALIPKLIASGDGLIVTITSVAAFEAYDNGAGYTSAKHAQAVLHRTLRGELLGQPVRLTEVAPGAVETEFSLVRFEGDKDRADKVYEGITRSSPRTSPTSSASSRRGRRMSTSTRSSSSRATRPMPAGSTASPTDPPRWWARRGGRAHPRRYCHGICANDASRPDRCSTTTGGSPKPAGAPPRSAPTTGSGSRRHGSASRSGTTTVFFPTGRTDRSGSR